MGNKSGRGCGPQQVCPPIEAAVDRPTVVVDDAGFPCNASALSDAREKAHAAGILYGQEMTMSERWTQPDGYLGGARTSAAAGRSPPARHGTASACDGNGMGGWPAGSHRKRGSDAVSVGPHSTVPSSPFAFLFRTHRYAHPKPLLLRRGLISCLCFLFRVSCF